MADQLSIKLATLVVWETISHTYSLTTGCTGATNNTLMITKYLTILEALNVTVLTACWPPRAHMTTVFCKPVSALPHYHSTTLPQYHSTIEPQYQAATCWLRLSGCDSDSEQALSLTWETFWLAATPSLSAGNQLSTVNRNHSQT